MAVFSIAEDNGKTAVYPKKRDLRNLLFYGYNHSVSTVMENLYPVVMESVIGCIYSQFLYLQWRRVKPLNTRALHYILSFDTQRWEKDIDRCKMTSIMCLLNAELFQEYQHILFLHTDKPTHHHIHIIVNPVNVKTYHVCRDTQKSLGWKIAELLGCMYDIPLQSFSYRDYDGRVKIGNETGIDLYKDKQAKAFGFQDRIQYFT